MTNMSLTGSKQIYKEIKKHRNKHMKTSINSKLKDHMYEC